MKKSKNICFVYDGEYPWDVRVEKISETLVKAGHVVHLVCRNQNRQIRFENSSKFSINRLPKFRSHLSNRIGNSTLFFNPYWFSAIFRVAKTNRCRIIIIRDLPLALTGVLVGKLLGIPVITDMAEPYPLTLKQRLKFEPIQPLHLITRNFLFADILELLVIKHSHHILVVCEEAKKRLLKKGGKGSRITIIRNTPRINGYPSRSSHIPPSLGVTRGKFIIMYVGLLIGGRGIELTMRAVKTIDKAQEKLRLVIIGSGKKEYQLRSIAQKIGVEHMVIFKGWIEHDKVYDYIRACDIGILPFRATEHMHHTVANKLFDFWAQAKPVLCSDVAPMKRLIKETEAGYLFNADSEQNLAEAIRRCMLDRKISKKGEKGREFVRRKYNWSVEEEKLLDIVAMSESLL